MRNLYNDSTWFGFSSPKSDKGDSMVHRVVAIFLCVWFVLSAGHAVGEGANKGTAPGKPVLEQPGKATYFRIPIEGEIGWHFTATKMKILLEQAAELEPTVVILDLDTPGGSVGDAEKIINLIIQAKNLRFVAFVRKALSAGAAITLACPEIYMTDTATIGASTAYLITPRGMPEAIAEKYQSVWRATCRKSAQHGGHPSIIAEAMIDPDFALTQREESGRPVLQRNGGGKILKARGRILTLTANEAISCGLAKDVVQDLSSLGKSLSMADWKDIAPTYNSTQAKRKGLPEGLYESMFQKAVSLNLYSESSTLLQSQAAWEEWNKWLKSRRIIGLTVKLEVFLVGVDEEQAKMRTRSVESSIASVDSRIDSVRDLMPATVRNWRGGVMKNPERRKRVNSLKSVRRQYVRELAGVRSHPFDMYALAAEDSRLAVHARVSESSRDFLEHASIGTNMLVYGKIVDVELHSKSVMTLTIDNCKAGPIKELTVKPEPEGKPADTSEEKTKENLQKTK